jgi:hypothetical protein
LTIALIRGLVLAVLFVLATGSTVFADCHWEVKGQMIDQTGQPIKGKVVRLWSQLGSGNASDPEVSGPRETNWSVASTDGDGHFVIKTSTAFSASTCTRGRVFGGTIGKNALDLGLYGPFPGPKAQGGVHSVDVGVIGPGVSADEVK